MRFAFQFWCLYFLRFLCVPVVLHVHDQGSADVWSLLLVVARSFLPSRPFRQEGPSAGGFLKTESEQTAHTRRRSPALRTCWPADRDGYLPPRFWNEAPRFCRCEGADGCGYA